MVFFNIKIFWVDFEFFEKVDFGKWIDWDFKINEVLIDIY